MQMFTLSQDARKVTYIAWQWYVTEREELLSLISCEQTRRIGRASMSCLMEHGDLEPRVIRCISTSVACVGRARLLHRLLSSRVSQTLGCRGSILEAFGGRRAAKRPVNSSDLTLLFEYPNIQPCK